MGADERFFEASTSHDASDRTGLLIIRAWTEPGSTEPLRAQVRVTNDVSSPFERAVTLTRPEAVGAMVQDWLAEMSAPPSG